MLKACSAGSSNCPQAIPEAVHEAPAGAAIGPLELQPDTYKKRSENRKIVRLIASS
jgi:hypothetical protein